MNKFLMPVLTGTLFLLVLAIGVLVYMDKVGKYNPNLSMVSDICGLSDDDEAAASIQATSSWGKTGVKDGDSEVYLVLFNRFGEDDVLMGVSSNAAKSAEIHLNQVVTDGAMEMALQNLIPLPANRKVELVPGGLHIMLIDLTHDLKNGDKTLITLHFQNQGNLPVIIPIKDW